jgi:hypothetical protein
MDGRRTDTDAGSLGLPPAAAAKSWLLVRGGGRGDPRKDILRYVGERGCGPFAGSPSPGGSTLEEADGSPPG